MWKKECLLAILVLALTSVVNCENMGDTKKPDQQSKSRYDQFRLKSKTEIIVEEKIIPLLRYAIRYEDDETLLLIIKTLLVIRKNMTAELKKSSYISVDSEGNIDIGTTTFIDSMNERASGIMCKSSNFFTIRIFKDIVPGIKIVMIIGNGKIIDGYESVGTSRIDSRLGSIVPYQSNIKKIKPELDCSKSDEIIAFLMKEQMDHPKDYIVIPVELKCPAVLKIIKGEFLIVEKSKNVKCDMHNRYQMFQKYTFQEKFNHDLRGV